MKANKFWAPAIAVLTLVLGGAGAAQAEDTTGADQGSTSQEVQADIAAIPNDNAKRAAEERVAQLIAVGAQVLNITYAAYVPSEVQSSVVSPLALPPDCGMTGYVWYYGGAVRDELATDCGSTRYSKLHHLHRITGVNPFNPYDTKILSEAGRSWGSGTGASSTLTWGCQNTNMTNFYGFGRGTLTYGGATYTAEVSDFEAHISCGW